MKRLRIFALSNIEKYDWGTSPVNDTGFFYAIKTATADFNTAARIYRAGLEPVTRRTTMFDSGNLRAAFFVRIKGLSVKHPNHARISSTAPSAQSCLLGAAYPKVREIVASRPGYRSPKGSAHKSTEGLPRQTAKSPVIYKQNTSLSCAAMAWG